MNVNKLSFTLDSVNAYLLRNKIYVYLIVLLFLPLKDSLQFFHPQFWGEDGSIFFAQAVMLHWKSMVIPYAGYLHFVPRLIANLTVYFPYKYSQIIFGRAALLILFFTVNRCLSERLNLPYKAFFALSIILIPATGEVFLVLLNVQWILAPVLFLYVFYRAPKNFGESFLDVILILMLGLTGPFAFLCFPLYVWRYFKDRKTSLWLAAITVACGLQVFFTFFVFKQVANHASGFNSLWMQAFGTRFFADLFYSRWLPIYYHGGLLSLLALIFPFLLVLFLVPKAYKREAFCFCYLWTVCIFVTVLRLPEALPYAGIDGGRYVYLPTLFIAWLLILSLKNTGKYFLVAFVFLFMMLFQSMLHFSNGIGGDNDWSYYSAQIKPGVPIVIPIHPAGWAIRLYSK